MKETHVKLNFSTQRRTKAIQFNQDVKTRDVNTERWQRGVMAIHAILYLHDWTFFLVCLVVNIYGRAARFLNYVKIHTRMTTDWRNRDGREVQPTTTTPSQPRPRATRPQLWGRATSVAQMHRIELREPTNRTSLGGKREGHAEI